MQTKSGSQLGIICQFTATPEQEDYTNSLQAKNAKSALDQYNSNVA
jgi:hypothetical protein